MNNNFELNGKFSSNVVYKKIYLLYQNELGINVTDSIDIIKNSFFFKGKIKSPSIASLVKNPKKFFDEDNLIKIFIEPNKMYVTIEPDSFKIISFNGSKSQKEYEELNKLKFDFFNTQKNTAILLRECFNNKKTVNDTSALNLINRKIDSLQSIYVKNEKVELLINLKFSKENPSSYIIPYILSYTLEKDLDYLLEIEKIYANLPQTVKKLRFTKPIHRVQLIPFIYLISIQKNGKSFTEIWISKRRQKNGAAWRRPERSRGSKPQNLTNTPPRESAAGIAAGRSKRNNNHSSSSSRGKSNQETQAGKREKKKREKKTSTWWEASHRRTGKHP
ncbi:MAG: DUF4369 domain-containing protein, partial [Flavobacterium sp.]|nr:DUF4369 domain-containing protein [Flavobacterium sp.]